MEPEEVQRVIEAERQTTAIANDISLLRSEVASIQSDLTQVKEEIIGDAKWDGIRSKVKRHEALIRRITWVLAAITSALAAAVGKWMWDRIAGA